MKLDSRTKWVVAGLMIGMLLSSLDQTIVSTGMPTVVRELGGLSLYSWVFSIYMLTQTAAIPIFGKLADLYGRRNIYMVGMGTFILGSALSGAAHNMTELIVFRGLQGIGAGALMPLAFTIIGDIFPPERRGKMQGIFGAVFGLSSIAGPALGGYIVEHWAWRWIFYINLPFGFVAAAILWSALKEKKAAIRPVIDWAGALLLTGSIVTILLATVLGGEDQSGQTTKYAWGSWQIISMLTIGVLLGVLFVWVEKRAQQPILPLDLFRNRTIAVSSITVFLSGIGMFSAITFIPLFVQIVIGVTPSMSGYILTPMMLSMIMSSIVGGRLVSKLTYRSILVTAFLIMMVAFYLMSQMGLNTTSSQVVFYMILTGLGIGLLMPTFNIAVQSAVEAHQRGVATSSSTLFRSIGATVGVTIMGAILSNKMASGFEALSTDGPVHIPSEQLKQFANTQVLLNPDVKNSMPPQILHEVLGVFSHSINWVFATGLVFIVIALVASLFMGNARLPKRDPDKEKQEEGKAVMVH